MTPRFKEVPEHWQAPMGPYRQAPTEFGGEWWLVSPFTGEEPWRTQGAAVAEKPAPEGFVEVFGERPRVSDFRGTASPSAAFRAAMAQWEQDLRYFKRAGVPEWTDADAIAAASRVYVAWEMGTPRLYEGRYGWMARFTDSAAPDFEVPAFTAIEAPHLVVARYQIRRLEGGDQPTVKHPFVPPALWIDGVE